jgi:hypothetical protein
MKVAASLVADSEATEASQPSQGTLHDPAVASQMLAALDAAPGDARCDAARPTLAPTAAMIVALVSVHLVGSAPRATTTPGAYAPHRIKGGG